MTQKKVPINNCFECPFFGEGKSGQGFCEIDDDVRTVSYDEAESFPKWCSLEDM